MGYQIKNIFLKKEKYKIQKFITNKCKKEKKKTNLNLTRELSDYLVLLN